VRDGEIALDHYLHPRNRGDMPGPDAQATVHNPVCGDTTRLSLKMERGVIAQVRWQTEGCGTSIAASSMASEMLEGRTLDEAAQVTRQAIDGALGGLLPAKMHCAVLAADAIQAALADYGSRARKPGATSRRA